MAKEYCTCTVHVNADYTVSRPGHLHPALSLLSVKCLLSVCAEHCVVKDKLFLFLFHTVNCSIVEML